jgi:hypothetical protein
MEDQDRNRQGAGQEPSQGVRQPDGDPGGVQAEDQAGAGEAGAAQQDGDQEPPQEERTGGYGGSTGGQHPNGQDA